MVVMVVVLGAANALNATSAGAPGPSPGVVAGPSPTAGAPTSRPPVVLASPSPLATKSVTVGSIRALLAELADDSIGEIVVKDGTYHVSPSNWTAHDSLWIGDKYASRTQPILVRAETPGGVTFDGGGLSGFGGLSFEDGAHDQTWDGFTFANMEASRSGIIEVGGYVARRTPHDITVRNITIKRSCTGRATTRSGSTWDHGIYVSNAAGTGPHDLLFEDITVDGRGGLASAIHFDHGTSADPAAFNVTVRRLHVIGTQQAIILWTPPLHDITIEDVDVKDALAYAIRFESVGATGIVFSRVTSTGSGCRGFYSSQGPEPQGMTLSDVDLDNASGPLPAGCPK